MMCCRSPAVYSLEQEKQDCMQQLILPGFESHPSATEWSLFAAYLDSRQESCNAATLALYRAILAPFEQWRDGRPITAALMTEYLTRYRDHAFDTRKNVYRVLRRACAWLVATGVLQTDPFLGHTAPQPPRKIRKRRESYTREQVIRLVRASGPKAADRCRWTPDGFLEREQRQARALVLLLIDTALRAGEVCKLNCRHARAATLIVEGKGGHVDRAFISPTTQAYLYELAGDRADDDPLFRDRHGRRCSVRALRGILERLAARAEVVLPPRPLHAFRHYAAQQWVAAKIPDLAIRRLMRHESLRTTQIYTDQADEESLDTLHREASRIAALLTAADTEH